MVSRWHHDGVWRISRFLRHHIYPRDICPGNICLGIHISGSTGGKVVIKYGMQCLKTYICILSCSYDICPCRLISTTTDRKLWKNGKWVHTNFVNIWPGYCSSGNTHTCNICLGNICSGRFILGTILRSRPNLACKFKLIVSFPRILFAHNSPPWFPIHFSASGGMVPP